MRILKSIILTMAVSLFGFALVGAGTAGALSPIVASASKDAACAGLDEVDKTQGCDTKGTGVDNIVAAAVTILSFVAGIAAIVMVLIAGFKYITSNGDAGKVGSAKTTLVYALVGVVIAALAQILVHFVVNTAVNSASPSSSTKPSAQPSTKLCKDGNPAHKTLPATDPACK